LILSRGVFDPAGLEIELNKVKATIDESKDLWADQDRAQGLMKKQKDLEDLINLFITLEKDYSSSVELLELLKKEEDMPLLMDLEKNLKKILGTATQLELESLFTGELDSKDCFLEINAGAGGVESHDWAEMLLRMYLRYLEKMGFSFSMVHELKGEEAGIKSATIKIEGRNSFGWLKTESGVHRLVRISPFNAAGKRQTSFASVWVFPIIEGDINIQIEEKDLRIDTYRSSGAGGQHVNTTDSAVRITHLPTKIVVQCQNDRSQHRNKDEAMQMLKSRLYELELREKEAKIKEENAKKTDNSWGNQIRSYVLQPYQMVKDHRTDFQTSRVEDILNGDLKEMILNNIAYMGKAK
jgi:peptide chain release factor 2